MHHLILETKADDYAEFDFIYATKFNTEYGDIGAKAMWMNQSFPGPVAGFESQRRFKQRYPFNRFLRLLGPVLFNSPTKTKSSDFCLTLTSFLHLPTFPDPLLFHCNHIYAIIQKIFTKK